MLDKKIEDGIETHLLSAAKLLRQLQRDDWASDLEATSHAIQKDFEEEDNEYTRKYGFSHREVEL